MLNETRSESGPTLVLTKTVTALVYIAIFLLSEVGNGFVIFSLLVKKKRQHRYRTAMEDFVLSLATTDFLFTTLSLFNGFEYILDEWKFGVVACKIHAQLLEVTYTMSTLTLATISYSRCKAANADNPFKLLHDKPKVKRNIALIWFFSFIFNLPLLYGYTVVTRDGSLHCTNVNFNEVTRQTYYLVQAVLLFVLPITIMIVSQRLITRSLRSHLRRQTSHELQRITPSAIAIRAALSERRITKLLTWVWITCACCWSPFIAYRTVDYFTYIRKRGQVWNQLWHTCQVLVVLNSAINPFLYHRMTKRGPGVLTRARNAGRWCCLRRDELRQQVVSVAMGTMSTLPSRSQ